MKKEKVVAKKRMGKREFCVALAKDVIKQIKAEKLVAEAGIYCALETEEDWPGSCSQLDMELPKPTAYCRVCALGSLVAAYALKKDDTTIAQAGDRESIVDRLGPFFPKSQLDLIEATFERTIAEYDEEYETSGFHLTQEEAKASYKFAEKYDGDDEALLVGIMKNIVKNEGRFVPKGL